MTNTTDEQGAGAGTATIAPFRSLTDTALRNIRQIYDAVPPTRATLEVLFAVDAAQTAPTEAWIGYFVETAAAQLIWDERPTGTVTAATAAWVLRKFDEAPTLSSLALLVRLIEEAQAVPAEFGADVRRRAALFSTLCEEKRARSTSVPYLRLVA